MYLGILLGLAIAGLIMMWANADNLKNSMSVRQSAWVARHVGLVLHAVGASGAIGWGLEVFKVIP